MNPVVQLMFALIANVIAPIHCVHFSCSIPLVTARSSCFIVRNCLSNWALDLGLYIGVGACFMLKAWHIRCTAWLTNLLSETKYSSSPILYVQLFVNASMTSSCVFPFIAITITNAEKLSAILRMYLYPSFEVGSGPAKSR